MSIDLPDTELTGSAAGHETNGTETPEGGSTAGVAAPRGDTGDGGRTPVIVADWKRAVQAKRAPFVMVAEAHAALKGIHPANADLAEGARVYYSGLFDAFVQGSGRLVQLLWPQNIRGGLALTASRPIGSRFGSRRRAKKVDADRYRYDLHAVYDYRGSAELLGYAWQLDKMMIDTRLFIRGAPQRSAADTVYSCYADVIGSMDDAVAAGDSSATAQAHTASAGQQPSAETRYPALKQSVADARALVDELGQRQAEGRYLVGAVLGFLLTLAFALPLAITLGRIAFDGGLSLQTLLGCMVAGAASAILSVLLRTGRGNLRVRWRVGRSMTMLLGTFRPLVGAISGGIAYLVLQTQLVGGLNAKSDAFYWGVGVLAGFSERFVPDMLTRSADTLQSQPKKAQAPPSTPASEHSA